MLERKQPVHKYCKRRKSTRSKWWKNRDVSILCYGCGNAHCSPSVAASVGRQSIRNNKDEQNNDMAAQKKFGNNRNGYVQLLVFCVVVVRCHTILPPTERKYLCAHIVWEKKVVCDFFYFSLCDLRSCCWIRSTFNKIYVHMRVCRWICQSMAKLIFLYCSFARFVVCPPSPASSGNLFMFFIFSVWVNCCDNRIKLSDVYADADLADARWPRQHHQQ